MEGSLLSPIGGQQIANSCTFNGRCWIRTSDLLLVRRSIHDVIHGEKSSKYNWDCMICHSCRWTTSGSAVLKQRENGVEWREFSEARFYTVTYHPASPHRFPDIHQTIDFCRSLFPSYSHDHRQRHIAVLATVDVHHGRADEMLAQRDRTLHKAWSVHPECFARGMPKPQPLTGRYDQYTRCGLDTQARSLDYDLWCPNNVDRFGERSSAGLGDAKFSHWSVSARYVLKSQAVGF